MAQRTAALAAMDSVELEREDDLVHFEAHLAVEAALSAALNESRIRSRALELLVSSIQILFASSTRMVGLEHLNYWLRVLEF